MAERAAPVIGLALGSGSARGWAHIGVIQALEEMGIVPEVVTGTSAGSLVGAAYASNSLDALANWAVSLTRKEVLGLVDISLAGGMVKGDKLFGFMRDRHDNPNIEDFPERYQKKFAAIATDMHSGKEVWLTHGPVLDAVRASCALPAVLPPFRHQGRWMLDGGLVNPVPVSAARALGADVVIAVNLNAQLIGAHYAKASPSKSEKSVAQEDNESVWMKVAHLFSGDNDAPGMFDVISASVNIMQDRVTRSRMAGDPPEVALNPLLSDFALMDFHRAQEAIDEGRALVQRHAAELRGWAAQPKA